MDVVPEVVLQLMTVLLMEAMVKVIQDPLTVTYMNQLTWAVPVPELEGIITVQVEKAVVQSSLMCRAQ
jgi:hypothetical protein